MKKHEDVIVTLISFYLFNGNLLLICHSCCSKSGRFGKMETFTVRRVTRFLVKAWGARGGTHSYDYGDNPGTYLIKGPSNAAPRPIVYLLVFLAVSSVFFFFLKQNYADCLHYTLEKVILRAFLHEHSLYSCTCT